MQKVILPLIGLVCLLAACQQNPVSTEASISQTQKAQLDTLLNRYHKLGRFSGTVLIVQDQQAVYKASYGLADYENNIPFTDSTAFKVGKLSELLTAYMVRDLAKEGRIKLQDNIALYLPEIDKQLTIADLLKHDTGLPTIASIEEQNPELSYSHVAYTNQAELTAEGKSDLNYQLLGLLLERVHKTSFQEIVEQYSRQMELINTYYIDPENPQTAKGYLYHNYRRQGMELQQAPAYTDTLAFSAAGLKASASDMVKVAEATEGPLQLNGYLMEDGFSYALQKDSLHTLVILSNRRHPIAGEMAKSITALLNSQPYTLPLPRKAVAVNSEILNRYTGTYALNEQMQFEVLQRNDSLFAQLGPNQIHLVPQAENQFFMQQADAALRFISDSLQQVNQVVLLDGFLEGNPAKRIN